MTAFFEIAASTVILLTTGDFVGSDSFGGIQEDSEIINILFVIREFFTK